MSSVNIHIATSGGRQCADLNISLTKLTQELPNRLQLWLDTRNFELQSLDPALITAAHRSSLICHALTTGSWKSNSSSGSYMLALVTFFSPFIVQNRQMTLHTEKHNTCIASLPSLIVAHQSIPMALKCQTLKFYRSGPHLLPTLQAIMLT